MHKIIPILLIAVFFTGCNINKVNLTNDEIVNKLDDANLLLANSSLYGVKFYLPRGMSIVDFNDYNQKIKYRDTYIYLYMDMVGYHYKTKINYEENSELYYSKKLENQEEDMDGFIQIKKVFEGYLLEAYYNYTKIEVIFNKEDELDILANISYILGSVKYNDEVISSMFFEEKMEFREKSFDLFRKDQAEIDFKEYLEAYDKYIEEDEPNIIDIDLME